MSEIESTGSNLQLKQLFPWLKVVKKKLLRSFPEVDDDTLTVLQKNIHEEFEQLLTKPNKPRTRALYNILSDFYLHFCWKINWNEECHLKFTCVQILYYMSHVTLILSKGDVFSAWTSKILTVLKCFPGDPFMICDCLLLIKNIKGKYHHAYAEILRSVLYDINVKRPPNAECFVKVMLLFRRLKFLSKKSSAKKEITFFVSKIRCPADVGSWLSALNIKDLHNIKHEKVTQKLLKNQLKSDTVKKLLHVLFANKYEKLTSVNRFAKFEYPKNIRLGEANKPEICLDCSSDRVENHSLMHSETYADENTGRKNVVVNHGSIRSSEIQISESSPQLYNVENIRSDEITIPDLPQPSLSAYMNIHLSSENFDLTVTSLPVTPLETLEQPKSIDTVKDSPLEHLETSTYENVGRQNLVVSLNNISSSEVQISENTFESNPEVCYMENIRNNNEMETMNVLSPSKSQDFTSIYSSPESLDLKTTPIPFVSTAVDTLDHSKSICTTSYSSSFKSSSDESEASDDLLDHFKNTGSNNSEFYSSKKKRTKEFKSVEFILESDSSSDGQKISDVENTATKVMNNCITMKQFDDLPSKINSESGNKRDSFMSPSDESEASDNSLDHLKISDSKKRRTKEFKSVEFISESDSSSDGQKISDVENTATKVMNNCITMKQFDDLPPKINSESGNKRDSFMSPNDESEASDNSLDHLKNSDSKKMRIKKFKSPKFILESDSSSNEQNISEHTATRIMNNSNCVSMKHFDDLPSKIDSESGNKSNESETSDDPLNNLKNSAPEKQKIESKELISESELSNSETRVKKQSENMLSSFPTHDNIFKDLPAHVYVSDKSSDMQADLSKTLSPTKENVSKYTYTQTYAIKSSTPKHVNMLESSNEQTLDIIENPQKYMSELNRKLSFISNKFTHKPLNDNRDFQNCSGGSDVRFDKSSCALKTSSTIKIKNSLKKSLKDSPTKVTNHKSFSEQQMLKQAGIHKEVVIVLHDCVHSQKSSINSSEKNLTQNCISLENASSLVCSKQNWGKTAKQKDKKFVSDSESDAFVDQRILHNQSAFENELDDSLNSSKISTRKVKYKKYVFEFDSDASVHQTLLHNISSPSHINSVKRACSSRISLQKKGSSNKVNHRKVFLKTASEDELVNTTYFSKCPSQELLSSRKVNPKKFILESASEDNSDNSEYSSRSSSSKLSSSNKINPRDFILDSTSEDNADNSEYSSRSSSPQFRSSNKVNPKDFILNSASEDNSDIDDNSTCLSRSPSPQLRSSKKIKFKNFNLDSASGDDTKNSGYLSSPSSVLRCSKKIKSKNLILDSASEDNDADNSVYSRSPSVLRTYNKTIVSDVNVKTSLPVIVKQRLSYFHNSKGGISDYCASLCNKETTPNSENNGTTNEFNGTKRSLRSSYNKGTIQESCPEFQKHKQGGMLKKVQIVLQDCFSAKDSSAKSLQKQPTQDPVASEKDTTSLIYSDQMQKKTGKHNRKRFISESDSNSFNAQSASKSKPDDSLNSDGASSLQLKSFNKLKYKKFITESDNNVLYNKSTASSNLVHSSKSSIQEIRSPEKVNSKNFNAKYASKDHQIQKHIHNNSSNARKKEKSLLNSLETVGNSSLDQLPSDINEQSNALISCKRKRKDTLGKKFSHSTSVVPESIPRTEIHKKLKTISNILAPSKESTPTKNSNKSLQKHSTDVIQECEKASDLSQNLPISNKHKNSNSSSLKHFENSVIVPSVEQSLVHNSSDCISENERISDGNLINNISDDMNQGSDISMKLKHGVSPNQQILEIDKSLCNLVISELEKHLPKDSALELNDLCDPNFAQEYLDKVDPNVFANEEYINSFIDNYLNSSSTYNNCNENVNIVNHLESQVLNGNSSAFKNDIFYNTVNEQRSELIPSTSNFNAHKTNANLRTESKELDCNKLDKRNSHKNVCLNSNVELLQTLGANNYQQISAQCLNSSANKELRQVDCDISLEEGRNFTQNTDSSVKDLQRNPDSICYIDTFGQSPKLYTRFQNNNKTLGPLICKMEFEVATSDETNSSQSSEINYSDPPPLIDLDAEMSLNSEGKSFIDQSNLANAPESNGKILFICDVEKKTCAVHVMPQNSVVTLLNKCGKNSEKQTLCSISAQHNYPRCIDLNSSSVECNNGELLKVNEFNTHGGHLSVNGVKLSPSLLPVVNLGRRCDETESILNITVEKKSHSKNFKRHRKEALKTRKSRVYEKKLDSTEVRNERKNVPQRSYSLRHRSRQKSLLQ